MKLPTPAFLALVLVLSVGAGVLGFGASRSGRGKNEANASAPVPIEGALVLRVPRALGNIVLDGDMDDPGWQKVSARTHAFVGPDGVSAARPHSEARFVWSDGYLYVGLYAADEDIRADSREHDVSAPGEDSFHVVFSDGKTERVLEINPLGVLVDGTRRAGSSDPLNLSWESEAHVSVDRDGTPNNPKDRDEEWVVEMAIPFEALGLRGEKGETIGLSMRRCDTLRKTTTTLCGTWGAAEPSEVDPGRTPNRGVLLLD